MIRTRFTQMFGLQYPIMSAPMAMHSGGQLAAAVTRAGALGSFGGIHRTKGPDWLQTEIEYIRSQTEGPFGVGFITGFIPMLKPLFDAAIEAKPPVLALSFGRPSSYIEQAKAAGSKVVCQVQSFESAREAAAAGADILVAQGNEAGGHTGTMNLLPLLARIVDAFPDIPVLAAGGISSGRALAGVLAAGADGAWVGTALLATPECIEVSDDHKRLIIESDGEDTVFTRAYDIIFGMPWPEGIGERVRRNRFTDEWAHREDDVRVQREKLASQFADVGDRPDLDRDAILYGQGAAFVSAIRPAADVLRTICDDAERILRERLPELLA